MGFDMVRVRPIIVLSKNSGGGSSWQMSRSGDGGTL